MIISVIIPTYNRRESLKSTLESLINLDYPRDKYEIIVVDDGSTDGTRRMVEELASEISDLPISYIYQNKKGPSSARNLGMKEAEGEIFVFTDDDCTFERDWLAKLIKPLEAPEVGAVGGPDRAYPDDPFFSRCVDYTMTSFLGTGGLRGKKGVKLARFYPRSFNMAVRK